MFLIFNTFFLIFFGIQAATDDYLVIKSRTEKDTNYYRVPGGLRQIDKDYTFHEVSPGIWNRIHKNSFFVIDSSSNDQNAFSIEFFPVLQKQKLTKDGFAHTSFLLPTEQIQAFNAVLCPLSKGLLKQSIIAESYCNKKDFYKEFYKETVEKDVLQSQYWNQAIVESIQYLDSIKCNDDDATNAFRLVDFLQGSFAIKQVLINYLYDKDLIDSVIDVNEQDKTDFLKEYLLTNQLFHVSKGYVSKGITVLDLDFKEPERVYCFVNEKLRFFNCENITLPNDNFSKTYIINLSDNKIKEITLSDFDIFDPRIKIIFDFRHNPLSLKTKNLIECSSTKRYPKELMRAQNNMDDSFLRSEEYISNQALIKKFEKQSKTLGYERMGFYSNKIFLRIKKIEKKSLKAQALSDQKFIKICAILSSFVLFGLLLYNRKCMFIFPFCIAFFIKKFMDVFQHLKTIEIDLEKIGFDIKKNVIEQETILKIQNNIKKSVSKIEIEQNQIKINRNMHNYHQNRQYYDFESSLIKNSWYILYD